MNTSKNIDEIRIPVPWGHVAAKTWGNARDIPILAFHGLMDNAGTFDFLIPFLPNCFYYICIDLPGHGRSSYFPPHLPVYSLNYILVYKLIMDYFEKKHYIIMGHSYGGQIALLFAQLYPEYVEKLIMLDTINFFPVTVHQFKEYLVDRFDDFLNVEEKVSTKREPTYTFEEALEKIQVRRNNGPLATKEASALLERAIVPTDNGRYKFSLDQRIKNFVNPIRDFRYIIETMKRYPVNCPILIILGNESTLQQSYMKPLINAFSKWKNAVIKQAQGNHDVHINNPEDVSQLINKFLLNFKGKL